MSKIPRLLIASTQSGSGKTTIVCGLLAAFKKRGLKCVGFKIGPDYIDPSHLRRAGGNSIPIYNLDTWMMGRETAKSLFNEATACADIALVEGVMGLYDGGKNGVSSSADLAKLLGLPVILVINARSMGESAAALALGFREYDKDVDLRGVILNGLGSSTHREIITSALERVNIPVLGTLTRNSELVLPERHLGLVPTEELSGANVTSNASTNVTNSVTDDKIWVDNACAAIEAGINLDVLLETARSAPMLNVQPMPVKKIARGIKIAVARDRAFSFYYPESLRLLERMGAELVNFSPLTDACPPDCDGMIFGGGFPEIFAEQLEANKSMRMALFNLAQKGLPILAECGGFMYLGQSLTDFDGHTFEMVGIVPVASQMEKKLQTVGYIEATMLRDTILGATGTVLHGHEFHFSSMRPLLPEFNNANQAFQLIRRSTGAVRNGGYVVKRVLASYLHLNLLGYPEAAANFLRECMAYKTRALF